MGFKKDAFASGQGGGKMTIASICSFLQDEWRGHEAAKNQWSKERKTLMGRLAELEQQCARYTGLAAMAERRLRMLESVMRREKGYPELESPEIPEAGEQPTPSAPLRRREAADKTLEATTATRSAGLSEQQAADEEVKSVLLAAAGAAKQPHTSKAAAVGREEGSTADRLEDARQYISPARSASGYRPPSPPPNFLRPSGAPDVPDPEALYLSQATAMPRGSLGTGRGHDEAAVPVVDADRSAATETEGSRCEDSGEPQAQTPPAEPVPAVAADESSPAPAPTAWSNDDEIPKGEAPFASAAVEAFAAEEEEEGSALAQKQGKRAPRAVAAVLESRAARGDSEEGPLEAREDDGAIPQASHGDRPKADRTMRRSISDTGERAEARPHPGKRPQSAGMQPPQASTRFSTAVGSTGFSNVGAGFQSAGKASGPASSPKGPLTAGRGTLMKGPAAKAKRPPHLRKPDQPDDVLAMAADLGIFTDETDPENSPTRNARNDGVSVSPSSFIAAYASPRRPTGGAAPPSLSLNEEGCEGSLFWHRRQPLRSHLSPVWDLALSWDTSKGDNSLYLLSASEDATLKLWSIPQSFTDLPESQDGQQCPVGMEVPKDTEPRVTLRGHSGPVTAAGLAREAGLAFSGGLDGAINIWTLPTGPSGLYSEYGSAARQLLRTLECHTDAVWSLAVQPCNPRRFVSASSDCTIRLWDTSLVSPNLRAYSLSLGSTSDEGPLGTRPVTVRFPLTPDALHFNTFFMAGFEGGQVAKFDIATGEYTLMQPPNDLAGPITGLAIDPTEPTSVFAAYPGGGVCLFDVGRSPPSSRPAVVSAHSDGCSAIAVSPSTQQVATGSPGGVVRVWDRRRLDVHMGEAPMHEPRSGEGVLSLEFAPPCIAPEGRRTHFSASAQVLVSAGADGVVQMMSLPT